MMFEKFRSSFVLGVIATGLALIFSIFRDIYLSTRLTDISTFVSYISLCALITTPFGERMQYGTHFHLNIQRAFGLILFGFFSVWLVNLILTSGFFLTAFGIGLIFNVTYCLAIASMIGDLTRNSGPHLIRLIGPIFPLSNIVLTFFGFRGAILLVNCSYLLTMLIVIYWYFNFERLDHGPKIHHGRKRLFSNSFLYHYLSFIVAYIFVLINVSANHENVKIFELRLPVYAYSISSFLLPYYGQKFMTLKNNHFFFLVIVLSACILLLYASISTYLTIVMLGESAVVVMLAYLTYQKTTKDLSYDTSK